MQRPAISPRDVTVIVQGPWHPDQTPQVLDSVARVLPGAEVVLSVWKAGPDFAAHAAGADIVLLNEDPGAVNIAGVLSPEVERRTNITNTNLNRQIVSTRNGLALAGRPYALKLRTDMVLEHAGFLDHAARWRGIPGPLRALEERVVTTSARSPRRSFCFFVQDFCSFGRIGDMRRLWDIPLVPPRDALLALPPAERDARVLVPEQHILLSALRRRFELPMAGALDSSPDLIEASERAIAGNLVCLDVRRFGVRSLKPALGWVNEPGDIRFTWLWILKASHAEFLSWCRRHCDHDFTPLVAAMGAEYEAELADVPLKDRLIVGDKALDPRVLQEAGERVHREGRVVQARNAYITLMMAGVRNARLFHHLGVAQIQTGDAAGGVATLEEAHRLDPGFLPTCDSLAQHFRNAGDAERAARWAGAAARIRHG